MALVPSGHLRWEFRPTGRRPFDSDAYESIRRAPGVLLVVEAATWFAGFRLQSFEAVEGLMREDKSLDVIAPSLERW